MTATSVYLLALLPAVLWGFTPILSKRGMAGGGSSLQAALVVVAVDSTLYASALFVVQGVDWFVSLSLWGFALFFVSGVVGTALGRLAVFTGVDRVGASINSATISSRPLFATILAIVFLGEGVGTATIVGIVVLVAGLAVLALSQGGDLSGWERTDLLYPLAAAVMFGAGNVARRYGLVTFPDITLLEAVALNEFGALVALGAYLLVAGRWDIFHAPKRTYAYFTGSGTITAVALLSMFAALQQGRVAIVDPLVATAPLFTPIFAVIFLRDLERVTKGVIGGAALVVLGVTLITAL